MFKVDTLGSLLLCGRFCRPSTGIEALDDPRVRTQIHRLGTQIHRVGTQIHRLWAGAPSGKKVIHSRGWGGKRTAGGLSILKSLGR